MSKRSYREALTGVIDRFENGRAVLRFNDSQELVIARRFLPQGAEEGDILEMQLLTREAATRHREDLARDILKEILRG